MGWESDVARFDLSPRLQGKMRLATLKVLTTRWLASLNLQGIFIGI